MRLPKWLRPKRKRVRSVLMGGTEQHIPELGGRVRVRGLTVGECAQVARDALRQVTPDDQKAVLMMHLLAIGIAEPRLGNEGAINFIREHPTQAARLALQIEQMSRNNLIRAGVVKIG